MAENNELLQSVTDVFNKYLSKNQAKYFNIPEYQRGYKWTKSLIKDLLKDIQNANVEDEKFYCLQNITIIQKDDKFNVIDGQQRLTTIFILLSYLGKSDVVKDKIKYSIREETHKFLTDFVATRKIWTEVGLLEQDYTSFANSYRTYDKPDTYYVFNAAKTIKEWFNEYPNNNVEEKLNHDVKFIINNLPQDKTSEETIFRNLNSDKVPLDGADLVRAVIVTRVANELNGKESEGTTKNIVSTNEYRVKIGLELDQWNNWWSQKQVKDFFAWFIKDSDKKRSAEERFDIDQYPINQLYLLYAYSKGKDNLDLQIFENGQDSNNKPGDDTLEMYKAILKLHHTLQDWYNDREIYHYLGYLFAQYQYDVKFEKVWNKWNRAETRDKFKSELRNWIKECLFPIPKNDEEQDYVQWLENIRNVKFNWSNEDKLSKLLILLDVVELSRERNDNDLPFLNPKYFRRQTDKSDSEDKEHILPQTPNSEKEDKRIDHFSVEEMRDFLLDLVSRVGEKDEIQKVLEEFKEKAKEDEEQAKKQVYDELNRLGLNSIGNIVLLHYKPNRQYKNNSYLEKRSVIIDNISHGVYIRQHTLNTFVKRTSNEPLDIWNLKDIENNAEYIAKTINDFFN
ncbi:MAG: DUF262 domain-containing protein [Prevotellaceae bacterium]|jgi:uncharacterized protein with ParB-like and HNH nuclease domain|nr:DUF262 domain-containing protein [Prevotellaceae bacterium]